MYHESLLNLKLFAETSTTKGAKVAGMSTSNHPLVPFWKAKTVGYGPVSVLDFEEWWRDLDDDGRWREEDGEWCREEEEEWWFGDVDDVWGLLFVVMKLDLDLWFDVNDESELESDSGSDAVDSESEDSSDGLPDTKVVLELCDVDDFDADEGE
ncbi:unnamed protein product [Ambrosiozyma monospora]|uniref:Unnamed protein product n=1 Tax=Ambrosiozyma monospora TaxID=43982 RepID=A0ACB5T5Q8_AMBMO|nr:unnamed protein product [Ambrosiozyma monospora]